MGGKAGELEALRAELVEARSGRRTPIFSDTSTPVFFVLGNAKSGTSWLMRTLNSHPEVLCRGEGRFFERSFGQMVGPESLKDGQSANTPHPWVFGAFRSRMSAGYEAPHRETVHPTASEISGGSW